MQTTWREKSSVKLSYPRHTHCIYSCSTYCTTMALIGYGIYYDCNWFQSFSIYLYQFVDYLYILVCLYLPIQIYLCSYSYILLNIYTSQVINLHLFISIFISVDLCWLSIHLNFWYYLSFTLYISHSVHISLSMSVSLHDLSI